MHIGYMANRGGYMDSRQTIVAPTAKNLIAESVYRDTTPEAEWDEELALDLALESDDESEETVNDDDESVTYHDYWGTDDDGSTWRVRLVQ